MNSSLAEQAQDAATLIERAWPGLRDHAAEVVQRLPERPTTVLLCGCGDSHHAADSLSHVFRMWAGVSALGSPALQTARYLLPELSRHPRDVLLIGISVSGETARTLEALELARQRGLTTLAITCQSSSAAARMAEHQIVGETPQYGVGPGLASYLTSLVAGLAVAFALAPEYVHTSVAPALAELPELLPVHLVDERGRAEAAAEQIEERLPVTFLGTGPAYGSAMFAAAKSIEAAGWPAWGQDTEEWAHVEYFANPPQLPVWILSSSGRAAGRELEVERAAERLGRRLLISRWVGGTDWPDWTRETLSPLALWAGPTAFADALMHRVGESPFRGFAGGRSLEEGGGANRIRSSQRLRSLKELEKFQPRN